MANIIGTMGVISMLAAYFFSQRGTMTIQDPVYLWMNCLGALGVLFSLFWAWNFPAFLIETAWAAISAWGLIKLRQK